MLPEDFQNRMERMLADEFPVFLDSYEQECRRALRVSTQKEGWERFLRECPFTLTPVPWAEGGYCYRQEDMPGKHPFHEAGLYYIQEPSAMAPAVYLMEGFPQTEEASQSERVLDLCSAPGGKSTQIAGAMRGRGILVCNEIHQARAKILSENIERMGVRNAMVTNGTPQRLLEIFPEYFTRILVDAPCSGEGMFRRDEAARGEWSVSAVRQCAGRQDEILDCAAGMLSPGGRLVYSTCTFAPEEDEGSIGRFLHRHPEFSVVQAERFPGMSAGVPEWFSMFPAGMEDDLPEFRTLPAETGRPGAICGGTQEESSPTGQAVRAGVPEQLEKTVRLWPHRIEGEGHYIAVLEKEGRRPAVAGCCANGPESGIPARELWQAGRGIAEFAAFAVETLREFGAVEACVPVESREQARRTGGGFSGKKTAGSRKKEEREKEQARDAFLRAGEQLWGKGRYLRFGEQLYRIPEGMPSVNGLRVLRPGLHLGTIKKNRFEPSHALALTLSPEKVRFSAELPAAGYLGGETFPMEGEKGWYLITVDGYSIGWGRLAGGIMKNHYPKGLRKQR